MVSLFNRMPAALFAGTVALLAVALTGCGGPDVASVTGVVTCQGEPYSGQIIFTPTGDTKGKSATATIGPDGSYELSTYSNADGAVIGRHQVKITLDREIANPDADFDRVSVKYKPLPRKIPNDLEREVVSGGNEINFEF